LLKIGTRDSPLALWQAEKVKNLLAANGIETELVFIKSKGDLNTSLPLHQLGTVGVFTKALDEALLSGEIDIAVHSCKDLPTDEPRGIHYAAYLRRDAHLDILVTKNEESNIPEGEIHIATGSIRRKAQWKNRFPNHRIDNIRGNVNTRLGKLNDNSNWFGAIFAMAGLQRLEMNDLNIIRLDWMIPAPAQGVIAACCRENDTETEKLLRIVNHRETEITSLVERQFLNVLEGGCSAPIGAFARIEDGEIHFEGVLLDEAGTKKIPQKGACPLNDFEDFGKHMAEEVLARGGEEIIQELKKQGN
jgi:hydroxymethylbilane synthase